MKFINMKKLGLGLITSVAAVIMLAVIPVYAASSAWTFSMSFHIVDGQANGQFHDLANSANGITIAGTISTDSKDAGGLPCPRTITVSLNDDDGLTGDDYLGSTTVTPACTPGFSTGISHNWPSASAVDDPDNIGEYYLVWSKGDNDWWTIRVRVLSQINIVRP